MQRLSSPKPEVWTYKFGLGFIAFKSGRLTGGAWQDGKSKRFFEYSNIKYWISNVRNLDANIVADRTTLSLFAKLIME